MGKAAGILVNQVALAATGPSSHGNNLHHVPAV